MFVIDKILCYKCINRTCDCIYDYYHMWYYLTVYCKYPFFVHWNGLNLFPPPFFFSFLFFDHRKVLDGKVSKIEVCKQNWPLASKHARSNSHLIPIGSEVFTRSRLNDSCTPPCFYDWIHLAKSWQPEPKQVLAGIAQSDPGHLWKNATESESGELISNSRQLHSARTGPNGSCTLACSWTRCVWKKTWPSHPDRIQASFAQYDPSLLWKNGTKSVAGSQMHIGRNGHNQNVCESDVACVLGCWDGFTSGASFCLFLFLPSTSLWGRLFKKTFIHHYNIALAHSFTHFLFV